jgi:uncharacterized membrane protein YhaH (DUF805 family)
MFNQYYLDVLKNKYADFNGRARRSEYWYYVLFNMLCIVAVVVVGTFLGTIGSIISVLAYLAILVPSIAVLVRRLHDVGKSGWFYFVAFIPLVGFIWLLVLLCTDSTPGSNEYGPNPKGIGNSMNDDQLINSIGK